MTMEKGYQRLFNGTDLTGWAFVLGANCPPKTEQGCAQTSPGSTFTVSNGILHDTGTPHGYMYPKKKFGPNFTLRAEYRYMPYPGMRTIRTSTVIADTCSLLRSMMYGPGRWKFKAEAKWR